MQEFMLPSTWTEALGYTMLHSLWQGGLIALVCYFVWRLIPENRPRWAYHSGIAALMLILLSAGYTFHLYYNPDKGTDLALLSAALESDADLSQSELILVSGKQTLIKKLEAFLQPFAPYLSLLWLIGVGIMSLRSLGGFWQIHRLKHQARPIIAGPWLETLAPLQQKLGIKRSVALKVSRQVKAPLTMGHFKPVILIPLHMLTGLPASHIEALLLHELAHIRRYDFLVNLLQVWVETLFFFHPAVWWISHRVRVSREWCCDDHAALACGNKFAYARALTTLRDPHASPVFLTVSAMGTNQDFSNRIFRLIKPRNFHTLKGSIFTGLILATLTFGLTLWINTPQTRAATESGAVHPSQIFTISFHDDMAEEQLHRWMAQVTSAGVEVYLHSYTVDADKKLVSLKGYVRHNGDMFILHKEAGQTQQLELYLNNEGRLVGSSRLVPGQEVPPMETVIMEDGEVNAENIDISISPERIPFVLVDGIPMKNPTSEKVNALDVHKMFILKPEEAMERLGDAGKHGAISITTVAAMNDFHGAIHFHENGQKEEQELVEVIEEIGPMEIIKHSAGEGAFFDPDALLSNDWTEIPSDSRVKEIGTDDLEFFLDPDKMPYVLVDGVPMESPTEEKINAYFIERANVLESKKAVLKYGKKAKHGALSIITRKAALKAQNETKVKIRPPEGETEPIYIVNGKKVDKAEIEHLEHDMFESISVYKDEKAIEKFGEEGKNGVVEITLKGEFWIED
ncbi:MAG: M56 family metallopeptidase, partial [Bacteroidota bacterium]